MMGIIITVVRTVLLPLSVLGYAQAVSRRIRSEFALGVVFTCIGSAMFAAGLLNVLPAAAWLICAGGVFLAVRAVLRRDSFRPLLCSGNVFFLICAAWFLFAFRGGEFTRYDNFSHWAVVTRILLGQNRFPISSDPYIMFQSYPLGSASFVYYGGHILGTSAEWVQMYWQLLLIVGLLAGLFAFSDRPGTTLLTASAALFLLLAQNGELASLLVDKLLGIAGLWGIAFCMYYRDELQTKLWWTIPCVVFLTAVKNSGLFFAVQILLYMLVYIPKHRRPLSCWLACALSPALTLLAWQTHVKHYFTSGLVTKHSMTLDNFRNVFAGKTVEDIHTIASKFFHAVVSPSNPFLLLLALLAALFLLAFCCRRSIYRKLMNVTAFVILSYAVYMASLFCMYLLTMPLNEALVLASYARYHTTILIQLSGVIALTAASTLNDLPSARLALGGAAVTWVLTLVLLLSVLRPDPSLLKRTDITGTIRDQFDTLIDTYSIEPGRSYLVLFDDLAGTADGYYDFLLRYLLVPSSYALGTAESAQADDSLQNYDYIIAYDDTEDIRHFMGDVFGDPDLKVGSPAGLHS